MLYVIIWIMASFWFSATFFSAEIGLQVYLGLIGVGALIGLWRIWK